MKNDIKFCLNNYFIGTSASLSTGTSMSRDKKMLGLESQLSKQILECKNKHGSWKRLADHIRKNGGMCNEAALKNIINGEDSKITINTLKGLYIAFKDNKINILEHLFQEILSFTSMFSKHNEILTFLPTRYSKDLDAMVINRFHFRAIEKLESSPHLQHINIRSLDVLQRNVEKEKAIIRNRKWFKEIHDNEKNIPLIVIGQPYINIASEYALARIFDVKPFSKKQIDATKQDVPIKLYWPHHEVDRKELPLSSFHIDWETLTDKFSDKLEYITLKKEHLEKIKKKFPNRTKGQDEYLGHRRCFAIGDNLYASHRREEQENDSNITNYGVLVIRRFQSKKKQENDYFICCMLGAYASDYLALAHRIFNSESPFPAQLPTLDMCEEPHILTVIIKNTVSKRSEFETENDNKEWRDITAIEVISSTLWHKKNEKWIHKESTDGLDRGNMFISNLEKDDRKIETNLY